jgi:hypothetical protein
MKELSLLYENQCVGLFGYWKLFDWPCDAAFFGKNRDYALESTSKQRFMGNWSGGTRVRELSVPN